MIVQELEEMSKAMSKKEADLKCARARPPALALRPPRRAAHTLTHTHARTRTRTHAHN